MRRLLVRSKGTHLHNPDGDVEKVVPAVEGPNILDASVSYPTYGTEVCERERPRSRSPLGGVEPWHESLETEEIRKSKPRFPFMRRHNQASSQAVQTDTRDSRDVVSSMSTRASALRLLGAPGSGKQKATSRLGTLTQNVTDFCYAQPSPMDWEYVNELMESVDASGAHAKTALFAVRRILENHVLMAQCRAVRAWGFWAMRSHGAFGVHAASTRLLSLMEEILENPLTFAPLRSDIMLVLGALAYRAKRNDRLQRIARLWLRVRPSTASADGVPLGEPLFSDDDAQALDTMHMDDDKHRDILQPMELSRPLPRRLATPPAEPLGMPQDSREAHLRLPEQEHTWDATWDASDHVIISDIDRECNLAHASASVLLDTLTSDDYDPDLVHELGDDAEAVQAHLQSYLTWATERSEVLEAQQVAHSHRCKDLELCVDALVSALSHIGEALSLRDEYAGNAQSMHEHGSATHSSTSMHSSSPVPTAPDVHRRVPMEDADTRQPPSPSDSVLDIPTTGPAQPSAKALGKRRAIEEGHFAGAVKPPLPPIPSK